MADSKQKLENDVFAAAGIAQKYNCALTRLDYQQEAGLMASVPIGENLIAIQRGLTTVEFEEDGLKTADMHDEMIIGAFSSIA